MKCNIFNPLDNNNGEFYLFAQYADDCTKEDALKTAYRVVPSKFAALNITLPKDVDINSYLPQVFQEFENRVLFFKKQYTDAGESFSPEITNNILWQVMENSGIINATNYTTTNNSVAITTFMELNYIGDINIYNNKRYNDTNYNEIYCHIGSENTSKFYAIEQVGTTKIYDYAGNTMIGWESNGDVLPNGTPNKPILDDGKYNIFGNYVPNTINTAYNDKCIDINRPSTAEDINVSVTQEGIGVVYAQIGSGEKNAVTFNDGETFNIVLNSDVREVTIFPNEQNIFIDGYRYESEDVNMTGIGTVIQNLENGIMIDPQVGSIKITASTEDIFKINTIILFYDIYDNMDAANPNVLYHNIPMGVYFTGSYHDETQQLKNTVIKYSNNDDVFGQGSSYNLRICTRNVVTPVGMLKYDTQIIGDTENYDNLASVMGGLHDLIVDTKTKINASNDILQATQDHLSLFKNYRTNIPYIRNVGGVDTWFVNGHNTGVNATVSVKPEVSGLQGAQGAQGAQGVRGVPGPQGPAGNNIEFMFDIISDTYDIMMKTNSMSHVFLQADKNFDLNINIDEVGEGYSSYKIDILNSTSDDIKLNPVIPDDISLYSSNNLLIPANTIVEYVITYICDVQLIMIQHGETLIKN